MNSEMFLDMCKQAFGGKVDLMPAQHSVYSEKLRRFTNDERRRIYDWIVENCKFFPKVADIWEGARSLGFLTQQESGSVIHKWKPTDCRPCAGSGMVAAWYGSSVLAQDGKHMHQLRLIALEPYAKSLSSESRVNHDVRYFFRCQCEAGAKPAGMTGLPRWSIDRPAIIERAW